MVQQIDSTFYSAILQAAATLLGLSFLALSQWLGLLMTRYEGKPSTVADIARFFESDPLYVYLAWATMISLALFVLPLLISFIYLAFGFDSIQSKFALVGCFAWAGLILPFTLYMTEREIRKMNYVGRYNLRDPLQLFLVLKESGLEGLLKIVLILFPWGTISSLAVLWYAPAYSGYANVSNDILRILCVASICAGIVFTINLFYVHYKGLVLYKSRIAWLQYFQTLLPDLNKEVLLAISESDEFASVVSGEIESEKGRKKDHRATATLLESQQLSRQTLLSIWKEGKSWGDKIREEDVWRVPVIEQWLHKVHSSVELLKQTNLELERVIQSRGSLE